MPRSFALIRLIYRTLLLIVYSFMALPGLILNAPVIVMARTISRKKAQEALAASTVKIAANDVLATWKVLVALALVPLCFVIYPIIAALLGYFKGWGALRTWAYFALLQPVAMYGSVRFVEIGLALLRSLRPLFFAVTKKGDHNELQEMRITLKQEIRSLVEALAPSFLQGKERLIKYIHPSSLLLPHH
jgi:glycerol-3-phosphate O-acyltransferase/dihydroxyacetone phosphate acyltransferase